MNEPRRNGRIWTVSQAANLQRLCHDGAMLLHQALPDAKTLSQRIELSRAIVAAAGAFEGARVAAQIARGIAPGSSALLNRLKDVARRTGRKATTGPLDPPRKESLSDSPPEDARGGEGGTEGQQPSSLGSMSQNPETAPEGCEGNGFAEGRGPLEKSSEVSGESSGEGLKG